MDKTKENTISTLKDLLRICKDEQTLFQTASEKSEDPKLKSLLLKYALEKEEYAAKLRNEIQRLGESPELMIIPNSPVNQINSEESGYMPSDILQKCLKEDDIFIQRYSAAIKDDILWEVVPIIAKQYFGTLNSRNLMMAFIKPAQKRKLHVVA